jgi:5'-deoxynucleotidase YfbR-like HD superfamily hydrolase
MEDSSGASELKLRLDAAIVKRYHTMNIIGQQTVGEHTYNVVQLIRYITEDKASENLIKAALDHDVTGVYPNRR